MDISALKEYPISDILRALNKSNLIMDRHYYGMYLSPFREESAPSFKID